MFFRRAAAFLLSVVSCFALSSCNSAEEMTASETTEAAADLVYTCAEDVHPDGIIDNALSAVVLCADNNEVIYGHDINTERPIASITKIMTALITLEYAEKNDKAVRITEDMYAEGSSMYLKAGEEIRLSELVKGMMAVSGNDAANAAAISISGSSEKFSELMNSKATELGMTHSHFVTPSGLDSEGHYSSAYDMALLCCAAMKNKRFADIVSKKNITAEYISPSGKIQTMHNHNKLLDMCEGCIGIKTGFTKKAGRTLTSCCQREGIRLITVTLNDGSDWNDHCKLFDHAFSKLEKIKLCDENRKVMVPLAGGNSDRITLIPEYPAYAVVMKNRKSKPQEKIYAPRFIYYPAVKGRHYGRIDYIENGKVIASRKLIPEI